MEQTAETDNPKAWKVPVLVVGAVLVLALAVFLVAKVAGWWTMVLVPAGLFGLAIAVNVVVRLIKGLPKEG